MEVESRQVSLVEQFVLLAKNVRGRGAAEIVKQATCEPGLFAFGELLDTPSIYEVSGEVKMLVVILFCSDEGFCRKWFYNLSGRSPELQKLARVCREQESKDGHMVKSCVNFSAYQPFSHVCCTP